MHFYTLKSSILVIFQHNAMHRIACCTVTLLLSLSVMSLYQRINWINSGLDATYQQQAPWHGTTDTGH